MMEIGYVVLEWNQASGQPRVCDESVFLIPADAELVAQWHRDELIKRGSGRRERYTVAEITELDDGQ